MRFFGFLGHWAGRAMFFMYVGTTVMDSGTWYAVIPRDRRERPTERDLRRVDAGLTRCSACRWTFIVGGFGCAVGIYELVLGASGRSARDPPRDCRGGGRA